MTSAAEDKLRIWDTYWRDSRLRNAGADNVEVKAALDLHWAQVAEQLPAGATILDIACGNGAAALAVARAGQQTAKGFRIAAIDTWAGIGGSTLGAGREIFTNGGAASKPFFMFIH